MSQGVGPRITNSEYNFHWINDEARRRRKELILTRNFIFLRTQLTSIFLQYVLLTLPNFTNLMFSRFSLYFLIKKEEKTKLSGGRWPNLFLCPKGGSEFLGDRLLLLEDWSLDHLTVDWCRLMPALPEAWVLIQKSDEIHFSSYSKATEISRT